MKKLLLLAMRNHVLCFALISIVYLQICNQQCFANPVCNTPNCKRLADYYKKNMNEQGNPCTDFYDYVCRNWGTQNPRPKYSPLWNVENLLKERVMQHLREILEDTRPTNLSNVQHARALYKACMNLPYIGRVDATATKAVMQSVGNCPMFTKTESKIPWWQVDSQYISKSGESSILDYLLVANIYNRDEITFALYGRHSPYGILNTYTPLRGEYRKQYKEFLINVLKSVAPTSISNLANVIDKDLENILEFREQLAEIIRTKDKLNGTTLITVNEFQEWYNKHDLKNNAAKVNWGTMIDTMNKNSKNVIKIQRATKIAVELSYFRKLIPVLEKANQRTIENHVHLYFAEKHLKLNAQMEKNLENSIIKGADATGSIAYEPERWKTCVNKHNMGITLGHEYIRAHFSLENKNEVQKLLKQEIELLGKQIQNSWWLAPFVINLFINKLQTFQGQIGFPNWYTPNVPRSNLPDFSPIVPDAFFKHQFKAVYASASYLQWPIYMPNAPYEIKYGAAGFVLAHELYHGFDQDGLNFDPSGNEKKWLPPVVYTRFNDQAQCFKAKYRKYKKDELDKRRIIKVPKFDTINEDISDAMGLQLAYLAYQQEFLAGNKTCPTLPGFENFDCDKLFFIAFGNIFCANSVPDIEEMILLDDKHSLHRTRVNGAVGNMKEFKTAFACPPKNPILPETICNIWK